MVESIIRRAGIISLSVFLSLFCFSQKEFNNWYFGFKAGITFNFGSPVFLPGNPYFSGGWKMEALVSDSNGTLLFFSAGQKVFNRNLVVMPNGDGLLGGIISGRGPFIMVVPFLNDKNKYYIFTVGFYYGSYTPSVIGLHFSVLNMELNGGFGDIEPGMKNIPVPMGDSAVNQLTAIRHHNNRDAWVVTKRHGLNDADYLAYLVTSSGIDMNPVVSPSAIHRPYWGFNLNGGMKDDHIRISPDGRFLVSRDSLIEVCQFNSSTGQVVPKFTYITNDSGGMGGFEFSADSRYLYASMSSIEDSAHYFYLVQYDMNNQDSLSFVQNKVIVGDSAGYSIQMAPDGKIYLNQWEGHQKYLNVINYPSQPGLSCGYQKNVLHLPGQPSNSPFYYMSLCTFLQRYKAYVNHTGNCLEDSIRFRSDIWPPADSIHWDFGDPASGVSNSSNLANPVHLFSGPGTYTVELWVRHNDMRTDTTWVTIAFPNPQLGPDRTVCTGDSTTFNAGYCAGCSYLWRNLPGGDTIGTTQTYTAAAAGTYEVAVTDTNGCTERDTVQLFVVDHVSATVDPAALAICTGDTAQLALSCNIPPCGFSWTAVASSPLVSGYSDGTGLVIDQPLQNLDTIDQTVTYTILPSSPSCSGIPLDYPVTVHPSPQAWSDPPSLTICSGQEAILSLSSNLVGTTFSWIAYGSSGDVTGFTDGTGPIISQVLQNSGEEAGAVTYLVTPVSGVGCVGLVDSVIVTILPVVEATIMPPSMTLCSGDTTSILLFCNLTGCDFSWTAVASSPLVSGFSGGTGDTIRQVLFNSDTADQNVTYSIVPSISGCGSDTTDYPVVIHPRLPVSVSISASSNPVCEGTPVTFIAFPVNGGSSPTYQWKVNENNAGMNNAVFTYVPASGDQVSVILTYNEACPSNNPATSNTIEMNVVEAPEVSLAACFDTITTTQAKPILLRGGIPLGGSYSGTGVTSSTGGTGGTSWRFDPAVAGVGVHEITYRYTNSAGCMDSAKLSILNSPFSILNCGDSLTDVRDNKKYPTVQIGSQCWMAAGLDYGTTISASSPQRDNCIPERYPDPGSGIGDPGSFYQWDELMQYQETESIQGLCPPEWHVPSEADWEILFANWTNNAFAGKPLLYTGFSGFNALLTGVQFFNCLWEFEDSATFLWSSTAHGPWKAWAHAMNEYNYSVSYYPSYRINAFSVRCVRD